VTVIVKIENTYEDGHESELEVELDAPEGRSEEELEQWWEDVVFPHTGDGHGIDEPKLGAWYEATIIRADDESLVGLSREWG
jgi:hypothetical protein